MLFSKLAKVRVQLPRGIPLRRPGVTLRVRLDPSRASQSARDDPANAAEPTPHPAVQPRRDAASETTLPFAVVVVFTALLSALLTAGLIATFRPSEATSRAIEAEERRARFAALDELRQLELERQQLEELRRLASSGDQRLDEEWGYLGNAASRLVEHQELSITRASALAERLSTLAERARQLSGEDGALPEALRQETNRMQRQAEDYLRVLRREIDRLEDHRDTLQRQIEGAELDRRRITLDGVLVRIIHDASRLDDAEEVAGSLRRAGASTELHLAPQDEAERFKGRLYYRAVLEEGAARRIARLAEPVELIEIEAIDFPSPFISLWLIGSRAPGLDDELPTLLPDSPGLDEESQPADGEP